MNTLDSRNYPATLNCYIAAHRWCWEGGINHGGVYGLSTRNESVINVYSGTDNNFAKLMAHEISHNFGCRDGVCKEDVPCVMGGGYTSFTPLSEITLWCQVCYNDFNPNK